MCVGHQFIFQKQRSMQFFPLHSQQILDDFIFVADFQQIQHFAASPSVRLWVVCFALSITSQMRIENSLLFHRLLDFNLNYLPGCNQPHIPYCQCISYQAAVCCSWKEASFPSVTNLISNITVKRQLIILIQTMMTSIFCTGRKVPDCFFYWNKIVAGRVASLQREG